MSGQIVRGERTPLRIYNSVHEFCTDPTIVSIDKTLEMHNCPEVYRDTAMGRMAVYQWQQFVGGRDFQSARNYFMRGADDREVQVARELLDKIDIEVHGVQGVKWLPQVYGAYPIVPDYLAGDPMCMRSQEMEENDQAPVRIVLDIGVPHDTPTDTIARRAAAATAFAMKLSEHRPVELWGSFACTNEIERKECATRIKLDMPTNMAQVMAIYNPSVCRELAISSMEQQTCGTGNSSNAELHFTISGIHGGHNRVAYERELRKYLELDPDDIMLHSILHQQDMEAIDRNPAKWVMDMLIKHGVEAEDY